MGKQDNTGKVFTIYHNPRCSKSREVLARLRDQGIEPAVVEYMKHKLAHKEFELLLSKLNMKPSQLLRRKEKIFREEFKSLELTEREWMKVMINHPELMERPIVVRDNKAVVGRPAENIDTLINP